MSKAGYVVLTLKFSREGRRWTGLCEELGTAAFGRSLPEAEKRLQEAILLHLNTLEEVGERSRFFREHNIVFQNTRPMKDLVLSLPVGEQVFVKPYVQRLPQACAA